MRKVMVLNPFRIGCLLVFFFLISNDISFAQVKTSKHNTNYEINNKNLKLSALEYEKLLKIKTNIDKPQYALLYEALIKDADKGLREGPFSVMEKTQISPSGSKHDYLSLAPYFWPDPSKSDGLPWIRKDGKVNPLTREGSTDFEIKEKMFHSTYTLAMAYFFSDNKQYADKAIELLNVWFLNDDTKMNPNLNFAQGIPGENSGRGIGIIEFAGIGNIITAIEILELNQVMNAETSKELRTWFTEYVYWLQTSDNGIFEKNTKNNHGTHYDAQVLSILLFLGRTEEAKQILETVKIQRIATQIKPNGEQPHELARTKSLSYSIMNLRGFTELATQGKKIGLDLWGYKAENGASIMGAYEFLKPYAKGEKKWDYQQLGDVEKVQKSLKQLFALAGSEFNIEEYCQIGLDKKEDLSSLFNDCY